MNTVPQDTRYHAEGNVAVHTRMVLEALQQSAAYQSLSTLEKEIVWAAALLHDVEKRSTSVDEGEGECLPKDTPGKGNTLPVLFCIGIVPPLPYPGTDCVFSPLSWATHLVDGKTGLCKELCEASLRVDTSLLKMLSGSRCQGTYL